MNLNINNSEQYAVIKPENTIVNESVCSEIEKTVAKLYAGEGKINFIIDLSNTVSFEEVFFKLLLKIQNICNNESGLLVLVTNNSDSLDKLAEESLDFHLSLPTLEEAIDAVFMNELENEFKDEENDEFGLKEEGDY